MSRKDFKILKEALRKQGEEVKASKTAAIKLLISLGFLTTRGTIPKYSRRRKFIP